jgi:drug/metabolite transporter (DMT)-like permease
MNNFAWLRAHPAVAAGITILLWASAFPAIHVALDQFEPIPLAAARFGIASVVAIAWLAWDRPNIPTLRDGVRMLACGAIGIALYNILLNTGQQSVSPGAASFIIATQPLFAGFLARPLLGEYVCRRAWLGSVISLCGVGVIALRGSHLAVTGRGVMLVLAAAGCSGTYFVLQKPLVQRYGALTSAATTILTGALMLSPALPSAIAQCGISARSTSALLFLALGAGVLAYPCWMVALQGLGAANAARWLFLMAPLATLISALMTRRVPEHALLAGGALVLVGVILGNSRTAPLVASVRNDP